MTNSDNKYYKDPVSLPNIGKSDHLCVLYEPIANRNIPKSKSKTTTRIFHKSAIMEFGSWLTKFNWNILFMISDVNQKIAYFFEIMWFMIDKFFPPIQVVVADNDKKWITKKIKCLIARRQKAHHSRNYGTRNLLAKKIRQEIKKAKIRYNTSKSKFLSNSNPKKWYQHISNIINNGRRTNLILHNVPELSQKPMEEIVNIINDHFATICKTYPPLDNAIVINENENEPELKLISEIDTYKLLKIFLNKSIGPIDFPRQILEEFTVELALPFSDIINCSLKTGIFPDAFKISEIIPLPKENPPRALKDLRPISKTPIGGKILEKMIIAELESDIKLTFNDPTQYGNTKGSSTTHYLIKLTDEAFRSNDVGHATTAITIDYSKAFDLVDHTILVKKLLEIGVRGKVIKFIISFLSDRKHYTQVNGIKSHVSYTTCGVPQGTISGPRLFTILIKGVKSPMVHNFKFVDDKTLAYSYSGDPTQVLQNVLDNETLETSKDKMKINESKCHVITFNHSSKNLGPQKLTLNGNELTSVDKIKLLGVIITSDLRWRENTAEIRKKVTKKFFMIWKLKQFGFKTEELLTLWKVSLRPIAEYAAPLWHPNLLECNIRTLEKLQKIALGLILGTIYIDHRRYYKVNGKPVPYIEALKYCNLPTLSERREILTTNFALETYKSGLHTDFFEEENADRPNTRSKPIVKEHTGNTSRLNRSAIPTMSKIINNSKRASSKD